ncbi:TPA: hypothetical protein ACKPYB_000646 [Stenotrophomonas maltophilia]
MSSKEYITTYVKAAKSVIDSPNGTARLLSGFSTLKNAADAGVTPSQMRAIFPDLRKYSDATIDGFVQMGSDMTEGKTIVASAVFENPDPSSAIAQ